MQDNLLKILDGMPSGNNGNGNGESTARSIEARLGTHSNFTIRGQSSFEPILDSEEAADLLHIHPKTLQRLARNGTIPGFRIGKLWGFRASALNEWLESRASS